MRTFSLTKTTVISELESLREWANANKLTFIFDPQESCYSVFKPLNKQYREPFEEAICQSIIAAWLILLRFNFRGHFILGRTYQRIKQKLVKYAGIFAKVR